MNSWLDGVRAHGFRLYGRVESQASAAIGSDAGSTRIGPLTRAPASGPAKLDIVDARLIPTRSFSSRLSMPKARTLCRNEP
jgi:hypothetical protein